MSFSTHTRLVVCFLVMFGFGVNGFPVSGGAQSTPLPLLASAVMTAAPGDIVVRGGGFSPGGLVYIALYDGWGTTLHETRWVAAQPAVFGINGSQDPAHGYSRGGDIVESFRPFQVTVYGANGSQDPAQGYVAGDPRAIAQSQSPVYGPNGSQDPAQGYDPGQALAGDMCDTPLMVRAFDRATASWSNTLDVDAGCR